MENAVDRETALKAMTIWAAYSSFEDKERGSITVGKQADFTILQKDIMTEKIDSLRSIKTNGVYIAGEKVWGE
jgi:predicted amidohydrolase YtcJ